MVIVWVVGSIHGNSQLVSAVPVIQKKCGCHCFGYAQLQVPMPEVIMEQCHVPVEGAVHFHPSFVLHQQGKVVGLAILPG